MYHASSAFDLYIINNTYITALWKFNFPLGTLVQHSSSSKSGITDNNQAIGTFTQSLSLGQCLRNKGFVLKTA